MPEPGPSCQKTNGAAISPAGGRARHIDPRSEAAEAQRDEAADVKPQRPLEVGGRDGPDPTRYGDWEYKGRCIDF